MIVYRLGKEKYKNDLSGIGAEKFGGRWNSKGVRMVYTSQSRALANWRLRYI
ncbi:RES family NAD+ phosphorylase [Winogradskyella maritima]|nr:RES family NAD+ phosphorylase [Winogradskyella maritima]